MQPCRWEGVGNSPGHPSFITFVCSLSRYRISLVMNRQLQVQHSIPWVTAISSGISVREDINGNTDTMSSSIPLLDYSAYVAACLGQTSHKHHI